MKTKTHYLYGFIIVSLVIALVIASVSKPTPKTIEITPPVERTTEMVTLPPSDTDEDTDDNTDESTEKIYHDKYYTIATYIFFFCAICLLNDFVIWNVFKESGLYYNHGVFFMAFCFYFIHVLLIITYFVIYIISMIRDTLRVNQYIILSLYLLGTIFFGWKVVNKI